MIYDLHNDLLTSGIPFPQIRSEIRKEKNAVIYAFWTSKARMPVLPEVAASIRSLSSGNAGRFAIEDLWFLKESDLPVLTRLPLLYCSLTWNPDNALAGGASGCGRLTNLGKKTVQALNAVSIAVDTAHLNERSFYEAVENARFPIDSHCGLKCVCDHPRNLDDGQVRLLLARGGIVGLTAVRDFLGGKSTAEAYARSLDTFVQRYDWRNLCVGTDFFGTTPLDGLKEYADFRFLREKMIRWGYTEAVVDAIFYTNAEKYIKNILKEQQNNGKRHL